MNWPKYLPYPEAPENEPEEEPINRMFSDEEIEEINAEIEEIEQQQEIQHETGR